MKFFLKAFFCVFCSSFLFSQADTVYLTNPSFEGSPSEGDGNLKVNLPKGWVDCGFAGESPPDVHPVYNGAFQVSKLPSHGNTYIGMVTRDNDTWERIGGKLSSRLKKGQCYSFSLNLARSEIYVSMSRVDPENLTKANYVTPIRLKIYGGTNPCDRAELIGETSLVRNSRWLKYSFTFQPEEDYKYLTFEAFYQEPTLVPYNGNLLMDNASALIEIPCDENSISQKQLEPIDVENDYEKEKEELKTQYGISQAQRDSIDQVFEERQAEVQAHQDSINRARKQKKAMDTADFNKLVALTKLAGKSIKFNEQTASFESENFEITSKEYTAASGLKEIFNLVKANPKLSILIGVKKKDGKATQTKRIEKIKAMVEAAGLNEDAVLVRKKNKIKWSYPWDAENGDLIFYVFDPEN